MLAGLIPPSQRRGRDPRHAAHLGDGRCAPPPHRPAHRIAGPLGSALGRLNLLTYARLYGLRAPARGRAARAGDRRGSPIARATRPARCRRDCASASRSRVRCCTTRRSSCSTNRPPASIRRARGTCAISSRTCGRDGRAHAGVDAQSRRGRGARRSHRGAEHALLALDTPAALRQAVDGGTRVEIEVEGPAEPLGHRRRSASDAVRSRVGSTLVADGRRTTRTVPDCVATLVRPGRAHPPRRTRSSGRSKRCTSRWSATQEARHEGRRLGRVQRPRAQGHRRAVAESRRDRAAASRSRWPRSLPAFLVAVIAPMLSGESLGDSREFAEARRSASATIPELAHLDRCARSSRRSSSTSSVCSC